MKSTGLNAGAALAIPTAFQFSSKKGDELGLIRRVICRETLALANAKLITRSYFVGICTGRSAGFALEDPVNVTCRAFVMSNNVGCITHQAA